MTRRNLLPLLFAAPLLSVAAVGLPRPTEFQPAASFAEVQRQHRRLPTDDIWWTVPYDFVASLKASRHAPPGERFSYSGLNTFVLAWLVEKLAGMPFQDALSREVWFHIGAESNASYIAPRYGVAVTHGGFMARLRDLARFGLLFTPSYGKVSDRRIISEPHVAFLLDEGNPSLLAKSDAAMPGVKHNIHQ